MKDILIIGGTRNMGYYLAQALYEGGHRVTLLNRGLTPDDLPKDMPRLRADRTDSSQMRRALLAKTFDAVIDFALYKGSEAETIVELLQGNTGHYIFISSGQVYLVREGIERPFKEDDYEGRLIPAPKDNTFAYEEWLYGIGKRDCEDTLREAFEQSRFPYTSLRLPMVNSARDPLDRLYNYYLRLRDGGPVIAPATPNYPLNHIYALDVVRIIQALIERGVGIGKAYNIAQDEHVSLEDFLNLLAEIMDTSMPDIVRFPRKELEAQGLMPDCSPFSERWMSALDNSRSKVELGISYTPLGEYLTEIVTEFEENPPPEPSSYRRRKAELQLVRMTN